MSLWRDIGNGVTMGLARCEKSPETCIILLQHRHATNGHDCIAAAVPLMVPCRAGNKENYWTVEKAGLELTLSPSISCPCGLHGFIREGRWVSA